MTEPPAPERIAVIWSPEARADLRAIDRETAPQIVHFWIAIWLTAVATRKSSSLRSPASVSAVATTACSSISKTRTPSRSPPSATAAKPTAERLLTALERMQDARPDRHRTKPGCSPDAACFSTVRLSLRRRRKGWCLPPTCLSRRAPRIRHSRGTVVSMPTIGGPVLTSLPRC
jgi:hypothetical protein